MINIGQYIETAINWLTNHFATFFDTLSIGIGGFIDSFQHVLYGIPFYITIIALTVLAWIKSGKGTAVFTNFGPIAYLRNGLLGRNHADIGSRIVIHLSRTAAGRTIRHLDCQQQSV